MMIVSARARMLVAAIALILLLPIIGIRLQDDAMLAQFHRHSLSAWPLPDHFLSNPVEYFAKVRAWYADRVYPIRQTSAIASAFLYFVLDTPPQRYISLGDDDFIFLNGADDSNVNGLLDGVCIQAHSAATAASLQHSLAGLERYAHDSGIAFDVLVIPTSATLYGDHVPASVPPQLRSACRERARGGSPLLTIQAPRDINYVFPFLQMQAARDDEAFFPKGNWHAKGLSLKVVRDAYLDSRKVSFRIDDRLLRSSEPSEVLANYGGVTKNLPIYVLRNDHVSADANRNALLVGTIRDLFSHPYVLTHYYRNSQAAIAESVLIVSDSYGDPASEVFAGVFQNVIQVTCSLLATERIGQLIERVSKLEHIDRVILLTEEGQVGMITGWSSALASLPAQNQGPPQSRDAVFKWSN